MKCAAQLQLAKDLVSILAEESVIIENGTRCVNTVRLDETTNQSQEEGVHALSHSHVLAA